MSNVEKLVDFALSQVGYKESGNNITKYSEEIDRDYPDFYNTKKQGAAWCDIFVDYCFLKVFGEDAALKMLCQPKKSTGAGCKFSADFYKKAKRFYKDPEVGDQIFFKDSDGDVCHTGLVYKVTDKTVYTIEGNTSSAKGVVANGGAVAKKSYSRTSKSIYGYGRPKYDAEPEVVKTESNKSKVNSTIQNWQQAAIKDGYKFP